MALLCTDGQTDGQMDSNKYITSLFAKTTPLDNSGTVVGESPDCLLLFGTVVGENPDHVCWDVVDDNGTRQGALLPELHGQKFQFMNWSTYYSRTPPCGHPTSVDTPPLWTLFARPV